MREERMRILHNQNIARDTWEMKLQVQDETEKRGEDQPLERDCQKGKEKPLERVRPSGTAGPAEGTGRMDQIRPGQFINIRIQGFYLRRPISISDWDADEGTITIVYKVVGQGTERMSRMTAEDPLQILWPLGNGYRWRRGRETPAAPLLVGGGAGVPPLLGLCRVLAEADEAVRPTVILGFRSGEDVFYRKKFEALGARVIIATEDGSMGIRGSVIDALGFPEGFQGDAPDGVDPKPAGRKAEEMNPSDRGTEAGHDAFFACGPEPMLKAVCQRIPRGIPGQLSFEERMGCGFGACMGCSCRTKYGSKRICTDGPVLDREEIVW